MATWPRAQEFGFPDEEACFGLQYGHGVGLSIWEQPVMSRLVSLDHPVALEPGMVFALENFWPAADGWSAARIEEEVLVTETGHEALTRFPAETLLVAGTQYWTATGPLAGTREVDSTAVPAFRGPAVRPPERNGVPMAEIVAAALTFHAPLITGKPEIGKPEQRDRLYADSTRSAGGCRRAPT